MAPPSFDNDTSVFRFSPILNNDHAGNLWIVTILVTIYSFMVALVRIQIKWRLYSLDDHCFGVAMVLPKVYLLSDTWLHKPMADGV